MSLIGMLLLGLIAGSLAKLFMPGDDPGGFFATIGLGIAGSYVGGFLFRLVGWGHGGMTGIVGSTLGAMVLLWAYRAWVKNENAA